MQRPISPQRPHYLANMDVCRLDANCRPQRFVKLQPLGRTQQFAGQNARRIGHDRSGTCAPRPCSWTRDLRGWPRSGSNRRWRETTAFCSPTPGPPPAPARASCPSSGPGCGVRKPGRPLRSGLTRFSTRRSLMLPRSVTAAAKQVGGQGDGLAVEVAAGNHLAGVGEHQRVVRGGVHLAFDDPA